MNFIDFIKRYADKWVTVYTIDGLFNSAEGTPYITMGRLAVLKDAIVLKDAKGQVFVIPAESISTLTVRCDQAEQDKAEKEFQYLERSMNEHS